MTARLSVITMLAKNQNRHTYQGLFAVAQQQPTSTYAGRSPFDSVKVDVQLIHHLLTS